MSDGFIEMDNQEPRKGEYCTIKVISYFKGWYMPECEAWSWLMDESKDPKSEVIGWKKAREKGDVVYELSES